MKHPSQKTAVKVGNKANADAIRELADKVEAGTISAYSVVFLENKVFKIDVTMKSGVMENDKGMYLALLDAMSHQHADCIIRESEMLGPKLIIQ